MFGNLVIHCVVLSLFTSSFAQTLTAKLTSFEEQKLIFVGSGCRVSVLDATDKSKLVTLAKTSDDISNPCISVVGLGVSTQGDIALVSSGTHELSIVLLQKSPKKYNLTVVHVQPVENYVTSRVHNGVVSPDGKSEIFFVAANSNKTGAVIAYQISEDKSIGVVAILPLPCSSVSDVQPWTSEHLLVSCSTGIVEVLFDGKTLKIAQKLMAKTNVGNDGMDVVGRNAYLSAGSAGLRVVDLETRQLVGHADVVKGWAGGVKVGGDDVAYVAADPGIVAFDVSTPAKPKHLWTCSLGVDFNGLGWNIDLDDEVSVAYVSDNLGGLFVVDVSNSHLPKAVSHYGSGGMASCVMSSRDDTAASLPALPASPASPGLSGPPPPFPTWGGAPAYIVSVVLTAHDVVKTGASWNFNYSYSSSSQQFNVSRYDHAAGQRDEVCNGIKKDATEPCTTTHATDGWMYVSFPQSSSCCKCTQKIGPVRSDWLQDGGASYVGRVNVSGVVTNEFLKSGASDNHYYSTPSSDLPVRYMEHKNGMIKQWDFDMSSYKKETSIDMDLFAPPKNCEKRCFVPICLL